MFFTIPLEVINKFPSKLAYSIRDKCLTCEHGVYSSVTDASTKLQVVISC